MPIFLKLILCQSPKVIHFDYLVYAKWGFVTGKKGIEKSLQLLFSKRTIAPLLVGADNALCKLYINSMAKFMKYMSGTIQHSGRRRN